MVLEQILRAHHRTADRDALRSGVVMIVVVRAIRTMMVNRAGEMTRSSIPMVRMTISVILRRSLERR